MCITLLYTVFICSFIRSYKKQKNPELFLTSRALYASAKLISSIKMSQKWTLSFPKSVPKFDQDWVCFISYSHVPYCLYISGSM